MPDLDILYEDNHLLILNKPTMIATEGKDSLENLAKSWIKEKYEKPGNVFLTAVHRLDKVASGIVVYAKSKKALIRLHQQIREGSWKKFYVARVEQNPKEDDGELIHYLAPDEHGSKVVSRDVSGSKKSILKYKKIYPQILEVQLMTGRKHQIRVQLACVGMPVCGDVRYGSKVEATRKGIDLHHTKLIFEHPTTKEMLTFTSSAPFC